MARSMYPVLAAAILAGCWPQMASAQAKQDFWIIATGAAADATATPETAAIILGAAMDYAKQHNSASARPILTQYQLMHAFVAVNRFDTYSSIYGNSTFRMDISQFTPDLADHLNALRNLANDCDSRARDSQATLSDLQREGLWRCARDFISIEVALRRRVKAADTMGLADALSLQGLFNSRYSPNHDTNDIIATYVEARKIFDRARDQRSALEAAERAFVMAERTTGPIDAAIVSANEPYIPFLMMQRLVEFAEEATEKGRSSEARQFLDMAFSLAQHSENIHRSLQRAWPCHASIGLLHRFNMQIRMANIHYAKTFKLAPDSIAKDLSEASEHATRMLAIERVTRTTAPGELPNVAAFYVNFLKSNGYSSEAQKIEEFVSSIASSAPASGFAAEWSKRLGCFAE